MKKIFSIFICVMLVLLMAVPAFATEDIPLPEGDIVEITDEEILDVGWVFIDIDVEYNRPSDFMDYNFYVNIVNKETGEWNVIDVYYDNDYEARATLPYGTYYVAEGGVKNDMLAKFALETGDEFTLDADNRAFDLRLGFDNGGSILPPEEEAIPDEPVQEEPDEPVVEEPPVQEDPVENETKEEVEQTPEEEPVIEEEEDNRILQSVLGFLLLFIVVSVGVLIYKRKYC